MQEDNACTMRKADYNMKQLSVDNIGHSIQMKKDDNLAEDPGIYLEDIVGWVL